MYRYVYIYIIYKGMGLHHSCSDHFLKPCQVMKGVPPRPVAGGILQVCMEDCCQ